MSPGSQRSAHPSAHPNPGTLGPPPMPQTHVRESLGAVPKDQEGQMP